MQTGIKEASPPALQQGYSIAHEGLSAGWLAFLWNSIMAFLIGVIHI
jgi:hypothetical protein